MAKKRTVLVVDDEPDLRTVLVAFFEGEGWNTLEADDGDEAVAVATRENPDFIILDVMMVGKSGFDAYKELRTDRRTKHIPVVFLSAINELDLCNHHTPESISTHLGVPPPEGFIEKPFDVAQVSRIVQEIFG